MKSNLQKAARQSDIKAAMECFNSSDWHKLPAYRAIFVKFISPTNTKGARIKLTDKRSRTGEKPQTKTISYDYYFGDILKQSIFVLTRSGFKVVGHSWVSDQYIVLCDNWGDDYKELKDINL